MRDGDIALGDAKKQNNVYEHGDIALGGKVALYGSISSSTDGYGVLPSNDGYGVLPS